MSANNNGKIRFWYIGSCYEVDAAAAARTGYLVTIEWNGNHIFLQLTQCGESRAWNSKKLPGENLSVKGLPEAELLSLFVVN